MSTSNQVRFINEIRTEIFAAHADMLKLGEQREVFRRKQDDGILTEDYVKAEVEGIERKMQKRHDECEDMVHGLIAARLEELDAADVLKADELNPDCQLLQYDFLTQRDVDEIARRNSSNPTVSRLVQRYADSHGLQVAMPSYLVELSQAKKETRNMGEVCRVALRWIGDERGGRGVLDRLFPQALSKD